MTCMFRYCNVDYVFASSLRGFSDRRILVSYDIACQWRRNLLTRASTLPRELQDPIINALNMDFVIPKFHITAHGKSCQSQYSLNFRRYMARTDGENIERGWAWMNPAALSMREMGPGARRDALDDNWSYWNFRTLTNLGKLHIMLCCFVSDGS